MSEQAVLSYLEATVRDPDLRARSEQARTVGDVIRIAGDAGYTFSEEDVKTSRETLDRAAASLPAGELSDQALDTVAGGVNINQNYYPTKVFVNINQNYRQLFSEVPTPIPRPALQRT